MGKPTCFGRIAEKNVVEECPGCPDRGMCQDRARQPLEILRVLREEHLDFADDVPVNENESLGDQVDGILDLFPEN